MKRKQFVASAAAFSGIASFRRALAQGATPNDAASLDEELRWAIAPGVSVATLGAGRIETRQAGVLLAGTQRIVTPSSIFEAASLSKPLFAYAVMERLVATGRLELDRPLQRYLSGPYSTADPRVARITARHVLTHTSGLPNWRHHVNEPLVTAFEPGTSYRYSGEGMYFLQVVVEAITDAGLAAFMRSTLDALGMTASSYLWRRAYATTAAQPHDDGGRPLPWASALLGNQLMTLARGDDSVLAGWTSAQSLDALRRVRPSLDPIPWNAMPNAAWSLFTTAPEYASFVATLLRNPNHPMLQPAVQTSPYTWRGLGIAIQVRDGRRSFYHTGSNPGFKAVMFGDLDARRGLVSFVNGDGGFPLDMHLTEATLGPQPAVFELEQPDDN